ncbi:hypothetical protein [Streptomyces sp. WAC08241]|uniref:hypothetical protein n=1 Tax=Streptomyces sp. WAC08241 TaxID=2487421 RepID=UPI000F7889EF|nr:hypothetical protein [Streptomyces sp. WAC08241]RSS46773.1 hypothetical protein EF906_01310 [Streptomyces sp. WAC08241]
MTHRASFRATAVVMDDDSRSFGIDAEPNERFADGVLGLIALSQEQKQIRECSLSVQPSPPNDNGTYRVDLAAGTVAEGCRINGFDTCWTVRNGLPTTAVTV